MNNEKTENMNEKDIYKEKPEIIDAEVIEDESVEKAEEVLEGLKKEDYEEQTIREVLIKETAKDTEYKAFKSNTLLSVLAHGAGYFTSFVGPLVIYLVADKDDAFTKNNAREAVNFNISMLIWYFLSAIFWLVLIGMLFTTILAVFHIVVCIIAAVNASDGKEYKYPLTIRFLK